MASRDLVIPAFLTGSNIGFIVTRGMSQVVTSNPTTEGFGFTAPNRTGEFTAPNRTGEFTAPGRNS